MESPATVWLHEIQAPPTWGPQCLLPPIFHGLIVPYLSQRVKLSLVLREWTQIFTVAISLDNLRNSRKDWEIDEV